MGLLNTTGRSRWAGGRQGFLRSYYSTNNQTYENRRKNDLSKIYNALYLKRITDFFICQCVSPRIELIKQISARYPRVPVLVMTMHDESLYWDRALRAGARGYVMKQEATEKVLQAIRKVLSGGVYVSDKMQEIMLQRYLMSGGQEPISFIDNLSDREFEILGLIGQGLSTVEIAAKLKRSVKTIEAHRASLKEKLGLKSAQDLTRFAAQWAQRKGQTADD